MPESHFIYDDHVENDDGSPLELAWISPADPSDFNKLMALRPGVDTRSNPCWVRLRDGSLMLAIFPCGDTYMEFSDGGVCDFGG